RPDAVLIAGHSLSASPATDRYPICRGKSRAPGAQSARPSKKTIAADYEETRMINRRMLALAGLSVAALGALFRSARGRAEGSAGTAFEISKSEDEWRKQLNGEQFYVLRKHGTERAGSSPLDKQYATGTYLCAGCDLPLFSSKTKFNSGTGWPSFYAPLENAIGTSVD